MRRSPLVSALALATPAILLLSACGDQSSPTEAARAGTSSVAARREDAGPEHTGALVAHDDCEPTSFDAAIRPGTCVKNGSTTFPQFIAELTATQVVRAWRFTADQVPARFGVDVLGMNVGGEEHTFTPVKQYGGGIVAVLNTLSGNPVPPPNVSPSRTTTWWHPAPSTSSKRKSWPMLSKAESQRCSAAFTRGCAPRFG